MKSLPINQIRIIGGSLRGRKIHFTEISPDNALRPTPNRVRETLFNWVSTIIEESECLDAFGGSGALTFEAISRGAKHVTLIEKCPKTLKNIRENAERFGIPSTTLTTYSEDALTFLSKTTQMFDFIFLDPPFQSNLLVSAIELITQRNLLKPNGYLYIESDTPILIPNWHEHRLKKAGSVFFGLFNKPHHLKN